MEKVIILDGFKHLFSQFLQEKLNREDEWNCIDYDEYLKKNEEYSMCKQHIVIRQYRNRNDLLRPRIENVLHENIKIIAWWVEETPGEEEIILALNSGFSAIISESQDWNEILLAIHDVFEKGFHHNQLVTEALFNYCRRARVLRTHVQHSTGFVGEREKRIIELRRMGKTSREIGEVMFLSKKTIDKIFGDLYRRFECHNFFELLNNYESKSTGRSVSQ